jgi:cell division protein YceG involved in septum cleavage
MKKWLIHMILVMVLALSVPAVSLAQTLAEAARQAARQHDAKVLSAHTVQQGKKRVHVIKLLTRNGVVKTIRITEQER